jgi:hypothetical protein
MRKEWWKRQAAMRFHREELNTNCTNTLTGTCAPNRTNNPLTIRVIRYIRSIRD